MAEVQIGTGLIALLIAFALTTNVIGKHVRRATHARVGDDGGRSYGSRYRQVVRISWLCVHVVFCRAIRCMSPG